MSDENDEQAVRLSREGKAFKTTLSWWENESGASTSEGLHGWVDRDSPLYFGSFRCCVTRGPLGLTTWKVTLTFGAIEYRARGYLDRVPPSALGDDRAPIEAGKRACLGAVKALLRGLSPVPTAER